MASFNACLVVGWNPWTTIPCKRVRIRKSMVFLIWGRLGLKWRV